jgi:cell wall-associated NlpC family hydrolase
MKRHRLRISAGRRLIAVAVVSGSILVAALPGLAGADAVTDKRAEAQQIAAKLNDLQSRTMDLNAKFEAANYALSQADAKVAEAEKFAQETAAELDKRRNDIKQFAVTAYQSGNDSAAFDALITSDSDVAVKKSGYTQVVAGSRQDLVDALNAAKAKADEDSARLDQAKAEAARNANDIEQARSDAKAASDQQAALNARAQGELASLVAEETARQNAAAAAAATAARAAQAPRAPTTSSSSSSSSTSTNPSRPIPPPGSGAGGAISAALSRTGSPYVWGAAGPDAFDCSGFTSWAYARVGINLPHYSGAQYAMTTRISRDELQAGDLVFYGPGGSAHVAIYMGNNTLVHTFTAPTGVAVTALDGWWMPPSGYGRINS